MSAAAYARPALPPRADATSEARAKRALSADDYRKYLPIVRRTAMRVARKVPEHITVNDLIGYAWIGLMEAFSRSDPEMPADEFEAYALHRIRGAMLDHLRSLDTQTRARRAESRRVTKAIDKLSGALKRPPEEEEIAAELKLTIEAYRALMQDLQTSGMARLELLDIDGDIAESEAELPEQSVATKELTSAVAEAVTKLPERLQIILSLYYAEDCTLREIGRILDLTESRICQLHAEAVHRLRAAVGRV